MIDFIVLAKSNTIASCVKIKQTPTFVSLSLAQLCTSPFYINNGKILLLQFPIIVAYSFIYQPMCKYCTKGFVASFLTSLVLRGGAKLALVVPKWGLTITLQLLLQSCKYSNSMQIVRQSIGTSGITF